MLTDKELKKKFKQVASKEPDKFYATEFLKKEGFIRKKCDCGTFFWTVNSDQKKCGDPACIGRIDLVDNSPAKTKLRYVDVWLKFKEHFQKRNYTPINRYPVVARWNPTMDFTIASIAAFQPYVISGESEPPAKKIVIPQFCLRFGDVDNVGVTGSHCTGFVMIGQHAFVDPAEWDQNQVFEDIYSFITSVVGIPKEELTLHEDSWAGGGNYGACMEFFSRGVELFNQVYMLYEHTDDGDKELKLKVLDMGLGMERVAWFSQGAPNIYEAIMPDVLDKIKKRTNVSYDIELFTKFSPYAVMLNADEVDNLDEAWKNIALKLNISFDELREKIEPMTAIYSIAEHARAILFALSDGALPSNVGGGYNLRTIIRRAFSFIHKHNWDLDFKEVVEWHANELQPLFPELSKNINQVKQIIDIEFQKFNQNKEKAKKIIQSALKTEITTEKLIELYDSHGIIPDDIQREAKKEDKNVIVPDNFYSIVAEMHEKTTNKHETKRKVRIFSDDIPDTNILYWKSYTLLDFNAKVLKISGDFVVLDQTGFYPTSGGQLHDLGTIENYEIADVFKEGPLIVHKLKKHDIKEGQTVNCHIDSKRRKALSIHHTATHILNGAAKKILGSHVSQAGAAKSENKARLDITHYETLSEEELQKIELLANEIIQKAIPVQKEVLKRNDAEKKYGFVLYQGGAVPGKTVRVIKISDFDIEACGGTHLDNTSEAEKIKIIKTTKIQDGIVRLEFVAGKATERIENTNQEILDNLSKILGVSSEKIPARIDELFTKWKKAKKAIKKNKEIDLSSLELVSDESFHGDMDEILIESAKKIQTQPQHMVNTVKRFRTDLENFKKQLSDQKS